MRAKASARALVVTISVVVVSVVAACVEPAPARPREVVGLCKKGTIPCGNGCMPVRGACCDDGTARTSSYCTNAVEGGCRPSNGRCKSPDTGAPTAFCCSPTTDEGSNDCPEGTHRCGLSCFPLAQPCCDREGSDECGAKRDVITGGEGCKQGPGLLCGIVSQGCQVCPVGSCCIGDPQGTESFVCAAPTGVCGPGPSSSDGGGSEGGT